jgi:hypothetical protein
LPVEIDSNKQIVKGLFSQLLEVCWCQADALDHGKIVGDVLVFHPEKRPRVEYENG